MKMNPPRINASPWTSVSHEREVSPLLGAVYITLSIAIVVINSLTIFINTKTKDFTPTVRCLNSIAITNLVSGLTINLYEVPYSLNPLLSCSDSFVTAMKLVRLMFHLQNVYHGVLCVVDVYLFLCRPRHYTRLTSVPGIIGAVALTFLLCGGALLLLYFQSIQRFDEMWFGCSPVLASTKSLPVVAFVVIVLPIVVIVGCYVCIIKEYIRRYCEIAPVETELPFKFPWMTVWVLISFAVCYLPSILAAMLNSMADSSTPPMSESSWMVADVTRHLYSVWNILIFTGSFPPFREQVFKLFCRVDGGSNSDIQSE